MLKNSALLSGISLLVLLSSILYVAYKCYLRDKHVLSLLMVFIFGLISRIFISLFPNLHSWDERFHALSAKNISAPHYFPYLYKSHFINWNSKDWMLETVWIHKPPLLSYILKLSMLLLGNTAFAVRFPSLLISSFLIIVLYYLAFELFGNRFIAIISAFLLAVNGFIIELSGGLLPTDHFDIFLMCFCTIAVYFLVRNINQRKLSNYILAAVFIALAFSVKLFTSFFVFYLLLFIDVFVSKLSLKEVVKNFSITCFVFLLIVVPTTYLTQLHSNGTFFTSFYQLLEHATKVYDQGGPWYFYLNKIRINYGEGIYVYLILSIFFLYYNRKEPKVVLLITWIAIPIVIFSMSETKMPGYILITAPAFFILYGFISSWILQNYRSKYAQWFIIITIFVMPLRYTIERLKPFTNYIQMYQDHKIYLSQLHALDSKSIVLNDSRSIETMYFSNATSYHYQATGNEIDSLQRIGYKVFKVLDQGAYTIEPY